jgi:hypothetical protein
VKFVLIVFEGFPQRNILQGARHEMVTTISIAIASFMTPVVLSFAVSVRLICFAKRLFVNKVELQPQQSQNKVTTLVIFRLLGDCFLSAIAHSLVCTNVSYEDNFLRCMGCSYDSETEN